MTDEDYGYVDVSILATARQREIAELLDTLPDQAKRRKLVALMYEEINEALMHSVQAMTRKPFVDAHVLANAIALAGVPAEEDEKPIAWNPRLHPCYECSAKPGERCPQDEAVATGYDGPLVDCPRYTDNSLPWGSSPDEKPSAKHEDRRCHCGHPIDDDGHVIDNPPAGEKRCAPENCSLPDAARMMWGD